MRVLVLHPLRPIAKMRFRNTLPSSKFDCNGEHLYLKQASCPSISHHMLHFYGVGQDVIEWTPQDGRRSTQGNNTSDQTQDRSEELNAL